ncbi:receptor expression-enhancing protein 1-like [Adelges cooleyi]|uniref:receptor expression-enhancing protein 1-like n=1 Tax=Adelges cooleyi TaxID=133065 RepID=UPI002180263C|nr:receptor expression-enhancing protein 1-like [Adelges cooleyi]XP_050438248.1 receptor expression-enhancing protein 1-like [Adelges cooleyi]
MIPGVVCKVLTLLFGVMYPAYSSYKTVKNKHVKNYVKWMMYWIVFATFTCIESLTDIFLEFWFPFYYDIKLIVLLWLSCPFTKGSTIVYKQIVHPTLLKKETDIDEFLIRCKSRTYNALTQTAKQTFQMTAAIVIQHTAAVGGLLPYTLLQQVANKLDVDYTAAGAEPANRAVKKKKAVAADDQDVSSSDEWSIAQRPATPPVVVQRPKRTKTSQQKLIAANVTKRALD